MNKDRQESLNAALNSAICDRASIETIKQLIALNADVNTKSLSGASPLHLAVMFDHLPAAELLIENHADINSSFNGLSPLRLAIGSYNIDMLELLAPSIALYSENLD